VLTISDLPALNATLNGVAALFLMAGFVMIRRGRQALHKRCMLGALSASTLFLISYVIYHANTGSRPFAGTGAVRILYFAILSTHVVLAALILPLALMTTTHGLRAKYVKHVKVARWTLPLWLYVSVTGVIIYLMLYHAY
jgi:putative membrane protein